MAKQVHHLSDNNWCCTLVHEERKEQALGQQAPLQLQHERTAGREARLVTHLGQCATAGGLKRVVLQTAVQYDTVRYDGLTAAGLDASMCNGLDY